MICPHCGLEHPDTTKFCPETGKKLEQQFHLCYNPDCNFRQPLPSTANFCPNCGNPLNSPDKKSNLSCELFMISYNSGYALFNSKGEILERNLIIVAGDVDWDYHYTRENDKRYVIDVTNKTHNLILVTKHNTEQLYVVSSNGLVKVCDYSNGFNVQEGTPNFSKFCKTKDKYIQVDDFNRNISSFYAYNNGSIVKLYEFDQCYGKTIEDVIIHFKYANISKTGLWHDPLKFFQEESDNYPLEIKNNKYIRFNNYKWVAYIFSSKESDYFCASKTMRTENNSNQVKLDLVNANGDFIFSLDTKCPAVYLGKYESKYCLSSNSTIFPVGDVDGNIGFMDIDGNVILDTILQKDITVRSDGNYELECGFNEKILNVENGQIYKQVFEDYLVELPINYESIVRHRKTGKIMSKNCLAMTQISGLPLYILAEAKDGYWDDERIILDKEGNVISKTNIYPDDSIMISSFSGRHMCWFNVDHCHQWGSFDNALQNVKLYDGVHNDGSRPQFGIIPLIIETVGKNDPYLSYVDICKDTGSMIKWNIPEKRKNLLRIESFAPNVILVTMQDHTQYLIDYNGNIILSGKQWYSINKISQNHFIAVSRRNDNMNLFDMNGKMIININSLFPNEHLSMENIFNIAF